MAKQVSAVSILNAAKISISVYGHAIAQGKLQCCNFAWPLTIKKLVIAVSATFQLSQRVCAALIFIHSCLI